jgi:hypothetical protein
MVKEQLARAMHLDHCIYASKYEHTHHPMLGILQILLFLAQITSYLPVFWI